MLLFTMLKLINGFRYCALFVEIHANNFAKNLRDKAIALE